MREILMAMMHNLSAMIEQMLATEWFYINKSNKVYHFCMQTIFGQT